MYIIVCLVAQSCLCIYMCVYLYIYSKHIRRKAASLYFLKLHEIISRKIEYSRSRKNSLDSFYD